MSSALKLCRGAGLGVLGALVASAQGLPNSIALTVAPGQTELGSFELTIPPMVKTATEVSMITVTQVSVQTTTVSALTTVTGLCAATTPFTLATSSVAVSSAQAASSSLPSLQALAALPSVVVQVPSAGSNASEVAIDTTSKATPSAAVQLRVASPSQCQCQCLCPASAFLAYGSMVAPPAKSVSTFQTLTSLVTAGQPEQTLVISAFPSTIPSAIVTSPVVSVPSTASASNLPGDSSISKSTSPLMDAVTVALNVRDLKQNT
ncbi:hypothetical protein MMC07_007579 [Pseudocyphellaria aurata]|nr:hypothetical protein [Pseudocyphellaria aurata]